MSFFTRDIMSLLDAVEALVAAQITGDTNGVIVDTHDYNAVAFLIQVAAASTLTSSHYFTITAEEGDAANLSDAVVIPVARRLGPAVVLNDTGIANSVISTGYAKGTKRYMRLVFTETGTADVNLSALALLGGKDTSWSPRS
jgi:hypothetical protein